MSEAQISDKNLVESLKGNTESMVILVRSDAQRQFCVYNVVSYDYLTEQFVLFNRRIIHHRNIQDAHPCQWRWSLKHRRSCQHCVVSQLPPEHLERGIMRSYPTMVQ